MPSHVIGSIILLSQIENRFWTHITAFNVISNHLGDWWVRSIWLPICSCPLSDLLIGWYLSFYATTDPNHERVKSRNLLRLPNVSEHWITIRHCQHLSLASTMPHFQVTKPWSSSKPSPQNKPRIFNHGMSFFSRYVHIVRIDSLCEKPKGPVFLRCQFISFLFTGTANSTHLGRFICQTSSELMKATRKSRIWKFRQFADSSIWRHFPTTQFARPISLRTLPFRFSCLSNAI